MAITGGIKFFDKNLALEKDGATITASSGNDGADKAIDVNRETAWYSVDSNDTTTETLELTFSEATTISRIILAGMNWKKYQVKYWNGSIYTDFTNVIGLDGSVSGISETVFADTTAYYEFDSVSTEKLQLTIDTTQTVDAEKELVNLIATTELGTLAGFPVVRSIDSDRNKKIRKALSGKFSIQESYESAQMAIEFRQYPVVADINLLGTLHDRNNSFLVWPCGGRRGTDYFKITQRGWRLQDIYNVKILNALGAAYGQNVLINGVNTRIILGESV